MIVFRDQTLATVAESARIKYVVGPTIAWYQEFLRYYFLTVEDSVDSSLTRRFAVLVLLLCLFGMLTVLLRAQRGPRHGQRPGVAADRHDRHRAAAADVHADEVGQYSSAHSPAWSGRSARSPRSRSRGSGCTAAATSRCT